MKYVVTTPTQVERPVEADGFTIVDGCLAFHRTQEVPDSHNLQQVLIRAYAQGNWEDVREDGNVVQKSGSPE